WFVALAGRKHSTLLHQKIHHHVSQLPTVKIDFKPPPPRYNGTKIALLIEERPIKHLTPLLLHMTYVVPPDWQLLYLGSSETLAQVNRSISVQHYQGDGKLEIREIPQNASFTAREQRNRLLTDVEFYKRYLPKTEWLLMYHSDSILCANARTDLNDWLKYDWVGAPWYPYAHWSGGGGLSLRRVSRIHQVLQFQSRQDDGASEDRWLWERVKVLPGIKLPKPEVEKTFAVEGIWDEKPMGIHVPSSEPSLLKEAWEDADRRRELFKWCPEVKMIMDMKLERERCQEKTEDEKQAEQQAQIQEQMEKDIQEKLAKEGQVEGQV
ncbi:MAG: hypothetical protein Q9222_006716, partial [Ikaeria aurantiellina]